MVKENSIFMHTMPYKHTLTYGDVKMLGFLIS